MIGVEVLIAPLRLLITALGTGVLPPGNPAEQVRRSSATLESTRARSVRATTEVATRWHGAGGAAATRAATTTQRRMTGRADDGTEFATVVESASQKVQVAATQVNGLLDSFERRAAALGPSLFTPAGFSMILPVAIDHVARGMAVVERTRRELASDTESVLRLARHTAPGEATLGGDLSTQPVPGGVAVKLPDGSTAYAPNERAAKAVRAALSQRGVPYVWGGTTPAGFDCSGFTQWAYRQAGVDLPRLAQDQDTAGVPVSRANLMPGDLAVWSGHVAMYIGNGQMVEAGDPVGVSPLRTTNLDQTFEGFFRPR